MGARVASAESRSGLLQWALVLVTLVGNAGFSEAQVRPASTPPLEVQEAEREVSQREVLGTGASAGFDRSDQPTHTLQSGDRLLSSPRAAADVLVEIPTGADLSSLGATIVEERENSLGKWLRLRWGGILGWLQISATAPEPTSADAVLADKERLARRELLGREAISILGLDGPALEVEWHLPAVQPGIFHAPLSLRIHGQFNRRRMKQMRQLTECLPRLYAQRVGGFTEPAPLQIDLVVFERRERYEQLSASTTSAMGRETGGFELDGLVVVAVESPLEIDFWGTVTHELTHALNRLGFAQTEVPPWVEEGVAEDLAQSVEAAFVEGVSLCKRPGAWSRSKMEAVVSIADGQPTKVTEVSRSARARSLICYELRDTVGDLTDLDRDEFATAPDRRWLYIESLLGVRALGAGEVEASQMRRSQLAQSTLKERLAGASSEEVQSAVASLLQSLSWRAEERALLDC